ncbi:MAG: hypothetical protein V1853_00620 [bacterium]
MLIAEVIPLVSLPYKMGFFDYFVPKNTEILAGDLVKIDFRNKKVLGIVRKLKEYSDFHNIKTICELIKTGHLTLQQIDFAEWLASQNYTSIGLVLKSFVLPPYKKAFSFKDRDKPYPSKSINKSLPIKLIKDQAKFYQYGHQSIHVGLIQQFIRYCLDNNKNILILFPEILMIERLVESLDKEFVNQLVVLHSQLTKRAKLIARHQIVNNIKHVYLGTSVSIFEPYSALDYIICTDESNQVYKQSDRQPHYHTRQAAFFLSQQHKSALLFTGRSPSVEIYKHLMETSKSLCRSSDLVNSAPPEIFDIRNKTNYAGNNFISDQLMEIMSRSLTNKPKSLLLYNKRLQSGWLACPDCGWQPDCQKCNSLQLVVDQNLKCRNCFKTTPIPDHCPKCHNNVLKQKSYGLTSLQKELAKLFPLAAIAVVHQDSEIDRDSLESAEIIIGTSRIFREKLPNLDIVCLVSLENELSRMAWNTRERVYFLLKYLQFFQKDKYRFIIQTSNPDQDILKHLTSQHSNSFLSAELADRTSFLWPPMIKLVKLSLTSQSLPKLTEEINSLYILLSKQKTINHSLIDCLPPIFSENKRSFLNKATLLLKLKQSVNLNERDNILKLIPNNFQIDINPLEIY